MCPKLTLVQSSRDKKFLIELFFVRITPPFSKPILHHEVIASLAGDGGISKLYTLGYA